MEQNFILLYIRVKYLQILINTLTSAAQVSLRNPSTKVWLCLLHRCADRNGRQPGCLL